MIATHAYVALRECGHPIESVVDLPDDRHFTAAAVRDFVAAGFVAERVTLERAREMGVVYCSCVPRHP